MLKIHLQPDPQLHAKQSSLISFSFQRKLKQGKTTSGGLSLKEISEDSPLVGGPQGKAWAARALADMNYVFWRHACSIQHRLCWHRCM